jgi:hypothetical protein
MDVGEIIGLVLVITHNGADVLECFGGDEIWQIECCLPKSSSHYWVLQKGIKHYCKTKMISKQIDHGILAMCNVGY